MTLDLDPMYHTESMVNILRQQGCTQKASELAKIILAKDPNNQSVRQILIELEEQSRLAFERFLHSSRPDTQKQKNETLS